MRARRAPGEQEVQSVDPAIQAAVGRQNREQAREPEEQFGDGQAAMEELRERVARRETVSSVDVSRARALKRLAEERAGRVSSAPRQLGRTA
ncbi:hypothetical protein [Streptomyces sp.]|uniref:hypothetical protein n=1 Tax=Streptomyces sp. TaxID=1931 RepID=UPI002D77DD5D|nr:hypothetical protein [Streptomyces sp.]HET6354876.1 hypothetical protein [Streptomyces sp.]